MKKVITCIDGFLYEELKNFIKNCITESLNTIDNSDMESLAWYKACEMDDYFEEWTEIYDDNDEKIGEGVDTISSYFVLNDDTRQDFERAFKEARDEAYIERMK